MRSSALSRRKKIHVATGLLLLAAFGGGATAAGVSGFIARAIADPSRPADDTKLDPMRKPAQVLAFSGIHPGDAVAEYLPGGGYYTRLLSDVVGRHGHVYALETTTWGPKTIDATREAIAGRGNVSLDLAPLGTFHLTQPVDLFWTTINYHDLHIARYAAVDIAAFNRAVFAALKPGGTYFIVDHAAAPGTGASASPTLHRIERSTVVREVEAAGFELVGESRILRNPADDHSKVVFDPSIRFHTDQFVLKFERPEPAFTPRARAVG